VSRVCSQSATRSSGHDSKVVRVVMCYSFPVCGAIVDAQGGPILFPSSSQWAPTFLLGCTRGGSPGIFG
ncbi:hypothetical protein KC221_22695, partial [Mycobacterium tuberculosis]|nr:hypothetical protein [Mycobacterium tuberculosis]